MWLPELEDGGADVAWMGCGDPGGTLPVRLAVAAGPDGPDSPMATLTAAATITPAAVAPMTQER